MHRVMGRHRQYFSDYVKHLTELCQTGKEGDFIRKYAEDKDNIRSAWINAAVSADTKSLVNLIKGMQTYLTYGGYYRDGEVLMSNARRDLDQKMSAVDQNQNEVQELVGKLMLNQAEFLYYLAEYDRSISFCHKSCAVFQRIEAYDLEESALNGLGNAENALGNYTKAQSIFKDCLARQRERGNQQGMSLTLHNLANSEMSDGNRVQAKQHLEESLN